MNDSNKTPKSKSSPPLGELEGAPILMVDNYDSFTFNLVHYLEDLGCTLVVKRNDQLTLQEVDDFDEIVLSPGPGIPDEAGLLKQIIETYGATKRIFGVCLGQQAIGEVYGGTLINLDQVYHGVATTIDLVKDDYIFEGLPKQLEVGRYHSWVVNAELPDCLEATSFDENGQVMSLRHKEFDIRAVQFHPESVLTPQGKEILKNWISPPTPKGGAQSKTNTNK